MLSILSLVMAGILCRGLSFSVPRRVASAQHHRTPYFARRTRRLSRVDNATLSPPAVGVLEHRVLGKLACDVVQGKADKVGEIEREVEMMTCCSPENACSW